MLHWLFTQVIKIFSSWKMYSFVSLKIYGFYLIKNLLIVGIMYELAFYCIDKSGIC